MARVFSQVLLVAAELRPSELRGRLDCGASDVRRENVTRLRARLSLKSANLALLEPQAVLTSAHTLCMVTRACNPSLGE